MNSAIGISQTDFAKTENSTFSWKNLYKIAGAAAALMAALIPLQVAIYIVWPPPKTITGWFTFFQTDNLLAMLDMDLLLIVDQAFMILIFLALYVSLRKTSPAFMLVALTLGLVGITAYFASSPVFNMLALSSQYATATTEAERAMYLAAGQGIFSMWTGTGYTVGYVIQGLGLLIVALVMLRSPNFSKAIAIVGVIAGIFSLVPSNAGMLGLIFSLGSLIPLEIWSVMLAYRFFQLGKTGNASENAAVRTQTAAGQA